MLHVLVRKGRYLKYKVQILSTEIDKKNNKCCTWQWTKCPREESNSRTKNKSNNGGKQIQQETMKSVSLERKGAVKMSDACVPKIYKKPSRADTAACCPGLSFGDRALSLSGVVAADALVKASLWELTWPRRGTFTKVMSLSVCVWLREAVWI